MLLVLLFLTGPLQYLPRCVLASIVFTIAIGMIDVPGLRDILRESPGEFRLAVLTAAAVVAIGVEQGILLAIALSLLRHVRHSYRPHTTVLATDADGRREPVPATPGIETGPGLIVYRFGADLFYANTDRFTDEVRALVEHAPTPLRWFVVDASATTDIDYSAARSVLDLIDDLHAAAGHAGLRARHRCTCARISTATASRRPWASTHVFTTLHEALAALNIPAP